MANPNQQQNEQQQQPQRRDVAANEDQELNPIDFKDEAPPVLKANAEGEGDDATAGLKDDAEQNEGEGSKSADRNYRQGIKQHLKKGNTEQEAKDAANALDDEDQKQELEDAEEAARNGRTIH